MSRDRKLQKHASELVKKVKAGRTTGSQKIHIPGYASEVKRQAVLDSGEIEMEEKLIQQLKKESNLIGFIC